MKKTGFTLAEVLITLTIIGVVATMTLPALMTNTQEQQAVTGLKKIISLLTDAAQMNKATAGFHYGEITDTSNGASTDDQSLSSLLLNRMQVDLSTSSFDGSGSEPANKVGASGNYTVFFRDGSAVSFAPAAGNRPEARELEQDGLPKGFPILFDYNGAKKPNLLSNCAGNVTISGNASQTAAENSAGTEDCSSKAKRVIRDQFGLKLRGEYAMPNGAAARWAYDGK